MTTTLASPTRATSAISPSHLSDRELLDATERAARDERRTTVALIELLAEVDARRLYLGVGHASLFVYCRQVLRLSEHESYNRIEAARAARRFPVILEMLRNGAITLTTVRLLRPHLTAENHIELLNFARHKSKHDVERQIAAMAPQADEQPMVRRLPAAAAPAASPDRSRTFLDLSPRPGLSSAPTTPESLTIAQRPTPASFPIVRPIAPARYVIKVTVGAEAHARLRRAKDLLQHKKPGADVALVIEEALTVLVERLERAKLAKVRRPRKQGASGSKTEEVMRRPAGRYIPAAIRRQVWSRDEGRCAFEGTHGRCTETGRLEFHHLIPFGEGGPTEAANLSLRCRAHNGFESDRWFRP